MSLALQDAEAVVTRAVQEGITGEVRGHLMADLLSRLQVFCNVPQLQGNDKVLLVTALEKLLLSLPDVPENQQTRFPLFVRIDAQCSSID